MPKATRTASRPLEKLERTIAARAASPKEKSYTSQLLAGGVPKIGAKVTEEAAEVVAAALEPGPEGRAHFIREVGDLVYHLLVLMRHQDCVLADVESELARRFGVSGLTEKASRVPKTIEAKKPVLKAAAAKKAAAKRAASKSKTKKAARAKRAGA